PPAPRQDGRARGRGGQLPAATTALGSWAFTNVFQRVRSTEFASADTSDPTPVSNCVTATTSAAANGSSKALPRRRTAYQFEPSVRTSARSLASVAVSELVLSMPVICSVGVLRPGLARVMVSHSRSAVIVACSIVNANPPGGASELVWSRPLCGSVGVLRPALARGRVSHPG